ncbi:MAG: ATP-binding protein [Thermomicrobiales bacterium]|nr:ATP-binding protein [Thermomicrobiales bacterium]
MEAAVAVPAVPESLGALHELLDRFWPAVAAAIAEPPSSELRLRFVTAVLEIAGNIVRHAYPPDTPSGPLELRLCAWPGRIEARFADRGVPYQLPAAPAAALPVDPDDFTMLPEGGYGLALVRAAVDHLDYERTAGGENRWRLVSLLRT